MEKTEKDLSSEFDKYLISKKVYPPEKLKPAIDNSAYNTEAYKGWTK